MKNAGTLTAAHIATAYRVKPFVPQSVALLFPVWNPSMWKEVAVLCAKVIYAEYFSNMFGMYQNIDNCLSQRGK